MRMLQEGLAEEFAKEERERVATRIAGVVDKYSAIMQQKVNRNWIKPTNSSVGLKSTLSVSLLPSGDVKSVTTVKSSGNKYFDTSAENAVYKAAPFTLPTDLTARAKFKVFTFIFKPE